MATQTGPVRPRAFTAVAILALVWNLIGLAMFWMQVTMDPSRLAAMPVPQQQVYLATPGWINVALAFAVIGGTLGALGLLLRRRWALPMFQVSLLGLLVQLVGAYAVTPAWAAFGAAGLVLPVLLLVVVLVLLLYARRARDSGWLR